MYLAHINQKSTGPSIYLMTLSSAGPQRWAPYHPAGCQTQCSQWSLGIGLHSWGGPFQKMCINSILMQLQQKRKCWIPNENLYFHSEKFFWTTKKEKFPSCYHLAGFKLSKRWTKSDFKKTLFEGRKPIYQDTLDVSMKMGKMITLVLHCLVLYLANLNAVSHTWLSFWTLSHKLWKLEIPTGPP